MTWQHEGNRHDRGYGAAWVKLRGMVLQRDQHLCQACLREGRPTPATDVDHITPKAQDGTDDLENLQSLCQPHHQEKTATERYGQRRVGADGWPA